METKTEKFTINLGKINEDDIWVEYEVLYIKNYSIEIQEVDVWDKNGNHICEGTGDYINLSQSTDVYIPVDWDGVISHAEVHDNIIAERHGDSIHAYAVKYYDSIVYLCRDNGSFSEIETATKKSFREWLEDFHNSQELEEEGLI